MGKEAEGHAQIEDSWELYLFERANVNCLAVVSEPVAGDGGLTIAIRVEGQSRYEPKVDSFDVQPSKFRPTLAKKIR